MTAPAPVYITNPKLTGGQTLTVLLANVVLWLTRSLIVWAFFAVFFPALGITYVLVMAALWALRHALPPKPESMVRAVLK
jgi:hypothetical protein